MRWRPHWNFLARKRRTDELRRDLSRSPERVKWRIRRAIDGSYTACKAIILLGVAVLTVATLLDFVGIRFLHDLGELTVGMKLKAILGLLCFAAVIWMNLAQVVFRRWYDRLDDAFVVASDEQEQEQLQTKWAAEDAASDDRWQERETHAGSMSLVENADVGSVSVASAPAKPDGLPSD